MFELDPSTEKKRERDYNEIIVLIKTKQSGSRGAPHKNGVQTGKKQRPLAPQSSPSFTSAAIPGLEQKGLVAVGEKWTGRRKEEPIDARARSKTR